MSTPADLKPLLVDGVRQLALAVDDSTCDRLLEYIALLLRWNATYNLTAVRDPREMVIRHLLDSLAVAPYVNAATLADVGSGAGLPGIPLALIFPQMQLTLIDSNSKMARFLREVVRALNLGNVRVEQQRVEAVQGQYEVVTARAFASLADMLALAGQLLAPQGLLLALKGRYPDDELAALPAGFAFERSVRLQVPGLDAERHLIVLRRA